MQLTKNISLIEVVPIEIHDKWGDASTWFIDPTIVKIAQELREKFGSVTINNKWKGGKYNYRGFRPMTTTVGGKLSQHRFGRALDLSFDESENEIAAYILQNEQKFLEMGLRAIENTNATTNNGEGWLHIDCRPMDYDWNKKIKPYIKVVNP